MGKAEKSWSGMRRYLEEEMLAPSLRGRIRYHCASYPGMMHGLRFEIYADGKKIRQFSMETMAKALYEGEKPIAPERLFDDFWQNYWAVRKTVPVSLRSVHDDMEFADALRRYRGQTIEASLTDEDPIVRMFAVLDRRTGKRTLARLALQDDNQPKWLSEIFLLRLSAEGIRPRKGLTDDGAGLNAKEEMKNEDRHAGA